MFTRSWPVSLAFVLLASAAALAQLREEVEGKVTFAGKSGSKVVLEITAGLGRITAELPDRPGICLPLLLHSRVRLAGARQDGYAVDGYPSASRLVVAGPEHIQIQEVALKQWSAYPLTSISEARSKGRATRSVPVRVQGVLSAIRGADQAWLRDESGQIVVQLSQPLTQIPNVPVELLGQVDGNGTNAVLSKAVWRPGDRANSESAPALPLLRTTEEVHALKPEDADAGYPVRIRGVVTSRDANGGMVQDATRGVYVHRLKSAEAGVGDYIEVEGATARGTFAPMINCTGVRRLGQGVLPDPIHPTWERLNNGSMDCQYVEIEGFVTEAYDGSLVLLMPEGHFGVAIVPDAEADLKALALPRYLNKHVRIRGTVFATRNNETHRVQAGSIGVGNATIGLGEPVVTLEKQLGQLLQFDARAAGFHRVRVAGQVLHAREREYYISDGANGLRFVTRQRADVNAGDLVEVVGFPRVAGSAPVLLEATVRQTGRAALPAGCPVSAEALSSANIGLLVQIEARLLGVRSNRTDTILELQTGSRSLTARLERQRGELRPLLPGSQLRLTGVYAGHGRDRVTGAEADASELLLNSSADISVLATPSWWTPTRALTISSSLLGVLLLVAGWVVSLRRQVDARTAQLKDEIEERKRMQRGREHAERQHLLEAERSRLARDLHDELGASLTEISLLANVGAGTPPSLERATDRFRLIADKAGGVVDALDVIVWAVNPATDALQPLADYVSSFVREFLSASEIRCRLKVPIQFPPGTLDSHMRHNLFLAVKETLNNAARHSSAGEVEFRMAVVDGCLQITVIDDGVGFDTSASPAGMGLANLRRRLEAIGGQCSIESRRGNGTAVTMFVPLPAEHVSVAGVKGLSL